MLVPTQVLWLSNLYIQDLGLSILMEPMCKHSQMKIKTVGIEKAITFPFPFTSFFCLDDINKWHMRPSGICHNPYELENEYIIQSSKKNPNLIPFLAICLGDYSNYVHVSRLIEDYPNIRGLKLHSRTTRSPI